MFPDDVPLEILGPAYRDSGDWYDEPHTGWLLGPRRLTSRSRVPAYADEDKRFFQEALDEIEVLATVPGDAPLPESFTKDNPKFGDFKRKYFKNNRYVTATAWDDQFRRTRVYLLDPRSIYVASKATDEYAKLIRDGLEVQARNYLQEAMAWDMLALDPHAWMHTLDLHRNGMSCTPLPDFEKFRDSLIARYEHTKRNQVNARRLVL